MFSSVKDIMVENLRALIINMDLKPGQRLNEITIAKKYNISRAPLREAFSVLEKDQLVVRTPRKGCRVRNMSIEDCKEIFQAREMVECYSIDLLSKNLISELPEVEKTLNATAALEIPQNNDPFEKYNYLKSILDFHVKLVKAAGNAKTVHFYNIIFFGIARYRSSFPAFQIKSLKEHENIIRLIKDQNYPAAKLLIENHIEGAFKTIKNNLEYRE